MQVSARLAFHLAVCALAAGIASAPTSAWAQASGGNPGQFGGGAPGQFDPNAAPAGGATTPSGATPALSPFGNANAGGVTPPPPSQPAPTFTPGGANSGTPSVTDQRLDDAKAEDSGRGLTWFWLEVGGGFEHVGQQTIDEAEGLTDRCDGVTCVEVEGEDTAFDVGTTGTGPMIDAGLGARLLFFTIGARARMGFFAPFDLARVGGEVGLRIPIGSIEPRINAGFGYAAMSFTSDSGKSFDVSATGYYARVGGGLDVFVSNNFALGGDASVDVIGLSRDLARSDGLGGTTKTDGSSVGLGVALGLHAGLHL